MSGLPTGTVAFLFTDIEGSSAQWDSASAGMQTRLSLHNSVLSESIASNSGYVVKTMGDGYMAVFERPEAAIRAAIEAQRRLLDVDWQGEALKVRMGIHTANVDLMDGDYLGPDVNRAARIEAAGHGGQILISAATKELAAVALSSEIRAQDLGRHELRGLGRPEQIYQIVADGLADNFPPLRTAEAGVVRNVPLYHTSFIGRDADLSEITTLLTGDTRLLTLVGQGGAGKTRLAAEVTVRAASGFANGAVFCQLAAVESEDLIVQALVDAIGFAVDTHSSDLDPLTQVTDYLRTRSVLVVLDNFEHLLGAAVLVTKLLGAGPGVTLLVTSRERLRLSDESVYEIGGLDESTDRAEYSNSLALFAERARQVDADFDPVLNEESIRRIGSALDGLPLGIELAAAWVDVLLPSEIADEIETGLDFLESQDRDRDMRHASLRSVFDSSWNRLTKEQQMVLSRLSIFRGGFDREAAHAVASADLRTMSTLVAKSLVRRPRPGRFDLHPLIGEFSSQTLTASSEDEEIARRHAAHYVGLLSAQRDNLDSGAQGEARDLLQEDVSNLRTALLTTADTGSEADVIDILEAVFLFYLAHSWHEGIEVFNELIDRTGRRKDGDFNASRVSASVSGVISYLVAWVGDLVEAKRLADNAVAVLDGGNPGVPLSLAWAALGATSILSGDQPAGQRLMKRAMDVLDPDSYASLYTLFATTYGWSFYEEGHFDRADEIFTEGLRVADRTGATLARAYAISKLGLTADARGEHDRAIDYHHEGREAFVKMGDPAGEAYTLSRLSWTYWRAGDYEKAREYALEGLFGFEQVNHRWGTLATLSRLGMSEVELGELESAEMHFRSLIARSIDFKMPHMGSLYGRIGLARIAAERGDSELAAEFLAALDADPETPRSFNDMLVGPSLDQLRSMMDEVSFQSAVERGRAADADELARKLGI
jgi:class 3 adenylate cyclase/tetratricopeptide (TPR) repeat protein